MRQQLGADPDSRVEKIPLDEKKENKKYWKTTVGYNKRWKIEVIISAFKRIFGDCMHSRNWDSMVQEIRLRIAMWNKWQEAAV